MKWYSGGSERSEQAIITIKALLTDLQDASKGPALQTVLTTYQTELESKKASVPLILSRLNLAIANALQEDGLTLSVAQSEQVKALTALSNIRYGY
ncbi:bacteriocin immunity protein [Latilactobacillus sakei]